MEGDTVKGKRGWKALFSKKVILAVLRIAVIIGVGTGAGLANSTKLGWLKKAGLAETY